MSADERRRWERLDALRGLAIVWMVGYHLAFDLDHFGFIAQNFHHDRVWTWQRTSIVSLFLFSAGIAQAIALVDATTWPRFWRRWAQIAGSALLVSAGSWLMFPRSWIFFGVLHAIAVMLIVVRSTGRWGAWLWLCGALALALPHLIDPRLFDAAWLRWLGLSGRKPITEDFVPLLPWLGVMWWGVAVGRWLLRLPARPLAGSLPRQLSPLAVLGRHSLLIYMLHQPLLIGFVGAAAWALHGRSGN